MQTEFVRKMGSLDQLTPEDTLSPENAVTAKYFDPFRSEPGTIMPAFGFKDGSPTGRSEHWDEDGYPYRVVGAFVMAGMQFVITSLRTSQTPYHHYAAFHYVDSDGVLQTVTPYYPDFPFTLPYRIIVDPNVYTMGDSHETNYREFYNAYIWGYNSDLNIKKPGRLLLCKRYNNGLDEPDNFELLWKIVPAALADINAPYNLTVDYAGPREPTGPAIGHYRYFIILEDIAGNWIYRYDGEHFNRRFESGSGAGLLIQMEIIGNLDGHLAKNWGFNKMYVYRDDISATDNDQAETLDESFSQARLVGIAEFGAEFSEDGKAYLIDRNPNQSDLTDLTPLSRPGLRDWCENANKAYDTIGIHNNAFWISKDNEVFFSEYTLDAPFGIRPLNFPTNNRWRFEGIGKIVDLLSQDKKLIVMGTDGIASLSGTYIDNFYEERLSSEGVDDFRPQYGEYIKTATVIDDKIFFVNRNGRPAVLQAGLVAVLPNILIRKTGVTTNYPSPVDDEYVLNPIDACRYRQGWMVSNGTTLFLLDPGSGQWVEWPEGVRRFFVNADPYYEKKTLSTSAATEYEYFEFIDESGDWRVYATDGTFQSAIWKTPKVVFDQDQKFVLLVFHWDYDSELPYGEIDIDSASRTAQAPVATLNVYLDDRASSVKQFTLNFLKTSDGQYRLTRLINCRGRKFAFMLTLTAGKYFRLTGWELKHKSVGRKAYA